MEIAYKEHQVWKLTAENIELMHILVETKHALCHACKEFKLHMDYYKNS